MNLLNKIFLAPLVFVGTLAFANPQLVEANPTFSLNNGPRLSFASIQSKGGEFYTSEGLELVESRDLDTRVSFNGEIGYQTRKNFRVGMGINYSLNSTGLDLRLSKAFGNEDQMQPYLGIKGSYNITNQLENPHIPSQSEIISETDVGVFVGENMPLSERDGQIYAEVGLNESVNNLITRNIGDYTYSIRLGLRNLF